MAQEGSRRRRIESFNAVIMGGSDKPGHDVLQLNQ
jgi:hypothetical protein